MMDKHWKFAVLLLSIVILGFACIGADYEMLDESANSSETLKGVHLAENAATQESDTMASAQSASGVESAREGGEGRLAVPSEGYCNGSGINSFRVCKADTSGTEGKVVIQYNCNGSYVTGVEIVEVYITNGNASC